LAIFVKRDANRVYEQKLSLKIGLRFAVQGKKPSRNRSKAVQGLPCGRAGFKNDERKDILEKTLRKKNRVRNQKSDLSKLRKLSVTPKADARSTGTLSVDGGPLGRERMPMLRKETKKSKNEQKYVGTHYRILSNGRRKGL